MKELFMGFNGQKWLESHHGRLVKFYRRKESHNYILHLNLNFTVEEHIKQLPFLMFSILFRADDYLCL